MINFIQVSAFILIFVLMSGCSRDSHIEVDGVECVKTASVYGSGISCNWEAYNNTQ